MNRRLKQLYFDIPVLVACFFSIWALWKYDDAFTAVLFTSFIFIIIGMCFYRISKTLRGYDMSTEAALEEINEILKEEYQNRSSRAVSAESTQPLDDKKGYWK